VVSRGIRISRWVDLDALYIIYKTQEMRQRRALSIANMTDSTTGGVPCQWIGLRVRFTSSRASIQRFNFGLLKAFP
jgi:hypothetical protein